MNYRNIFRRKRFFFEKKKQKTFTRTLLPQGNGEANIDCFTFCTGKFRTMPNEQKFFASFFQKRSAALPTQNPEH